MMIRCKYVSITLSSSNTILLCGRGTQSRFISEDVRQHEICGAVVLPMFVFFFSHRGENVEDAFLEAAKKIYQNIQDGSLDLNAAESGVQHKPSAPQGGRLTSEAQPQRGACGC